MGVAAQTRIKCCCFFTLWRLKKSLRHRTHKNKLNFFFDQEPKFFKKGKKIIPFMAVQLLSGSSRRFLKMSVSKSLLHVEGMMVK